MKEEGAGTLGGGVPYYEEIGELTAGLREKYRRSMK